MMVSSKIITLDIFVIRHTIYLAIHPVLLIAQLFIRKYPSDFNSLCLDHSTTVNTDGIQFDLIPTLVTDNIDELLAETAIV